MSNVEGRLRGSQACVNTTSRLRQNLAEWDLEALGVFGRQLIQVCAHKSSIQRRSHVVRVPLLHEAEVQHARLGQLQVADLVRQVHTSHDGGGRRAQPAAQRDGVLDVNVGLGGECADAIAAEDVDGGAGDEVVFGDEGHIFGAHTLVGDLAVEGVLRALLLGDGDLELKVQVEGESNDVEARANVGRRARHLDQSSHCGCWW